MRMWVICHDSPATADRPGPLLLKGARRPRPPVRGGGFTLVEIMVVLLMFALLVAVSAPGLSRLYARIQLNADLRELENRIAALPVLAYASGAEGPLEELLQRQVELPSGWAVLDGGGIYVRANGVCSGGALRLRTPSGERELVLEAPFCAPRSEP